MGGGGEIMAGRGWWQQIYGWSWMIVGAGGEIMTGRRWWRQNYGSSWVSWMVVGGRGWSWSHNLLMPVRKIFKCS